MVSAASSAAAAVLASAWGPSVRAARLAVSCVVVTELSLVLGMAWVLLPLGLRLRGRFTLGTVRGRARFGARRGRAGGARRGEGRLVVGVNARSALCLAGWTCRGAERPRVGEGGFRGE